MGQLAAQVYVGAKAAASKLAAAPLSSIPASDIAGPPPMNIGNWTQQDSPAAHVVPPHVPVVAGCEA
jgi:hypothetical protein